MSTTRQQPENESPQFVYEDPTLTEILRHGERRHLLWELQARGSMSHLEFTDVVREESMENRPMSEQIRQYITSLEIYDNETGDVSHTEYREDRWGDLADQVEADLDGFRTSYPSFMDWYVPVQSVNPESVPNMPGDPYRWESRRMEQYPVGVTIYTRESAYWVVTHRSNTHRVVLRTGDRTEAAERSALERAVLTAERRVPQERNDLLDMDWTPEGALQGALDDTADDLSFEFGVPRSKLYRRIDNIYESYPVERPDTHVQTSPNAPSSVQIDSVPLVWSPIQKHERSSSVADFHGGYSHARRDESILVWEGIPTAFVALDDGTTVVGDVYEYSDELLCEGVNIDGHPDQSPADDYKYVIEHHRPNGVIDTELAVDEAEVQEGIERIMGNDD